MVTDVVVDKYNFGWYEMEKLDFKLNPTPIGSEEFIFGVKLGCFITL